MKRLLSLLLVLILALGLMAGCGDDADGTENSSAAAPGSATTADGLSKEDVAFVKDGTAVYRLVRDDENPDSVAASQVMFQQLKKNLGVNVRNVSDSEDGTDMYEILIGNVNRPEVQVAKDYLEAKVGGHYNDYIIATVGKKIVIFAENGEMLKAACEYFIANYAKAEGVKGGIDFVKAAEGEFERYTVNGVDLGKFDFVRPHYNSSYLTELEMNELSDAMLKKTGYKMHITHDQDTEKNPAKYEIIVGDTSRAGTEKIVNHDEFKIKIAGEKIYINGGSAHATAMAVYEFGNLVQKGALTDADSIDGSYAQSLNNYDKSNKFYQTWGDDFDGDKLDTTKWRQEDERNNNPGMNGKLSVRSSDPNDVFVSDGKFHICAREDETTYYGGMIRTQNTMEYTYGYTEMSAVLPHGDGFWIALWACSDDSKSSIDPNNPAYTRPEIDIVECFGNSQYYAANCHAWPTTAGKNEYGYEHTSLDKEPYASMKKYSIPDQGKKLGDDFHTYGFIWDNRRMGFTCDGDLFFEYDTTTTEHDVEAFNHSMYLIFSMALGFADAPTPAISNNPDEWANTNKYICDWIHIYQKDDGMHSLVIK